ncbi:MAG: response regulator [Bacteroidetes bacterium]|nr:response regulator [Bacteroidota bacterium]
MNTKKPITIFIVEDNKLFSKALVADIENTFSKKSIKIQSFETGETCMLRFKEEMPQIVITDYHLNSKYPDAVDGIKLLDLVKRENPKIYVVMLTSEDDINIALKSFHHGASDYVVKTETKFNKIHYSLANIFNLMDAKREALRNRSLLFGLITALITISLIVAIQFL